MHAMHFRHWFHPEHAVAAHPVRDRMGHLLHSRELWQGVGIVALLAMLVFVILLAAVKMNNELMITGPYFYGF